MDIELTEVMIVLNMFVLGYLVGDLTGWRQGYKEGAKRWQK